jgi:hypothetical protein
MNRYTIALILCGMVLMSSCRSSGDRDPLPRGSRTSRNNSVPDEMIATPSPRESLPNYAHDQSIRNTDDLIKNDKEKGFIAVDNNDSHSFPEDYQYDSMKDSYDDKKKKKSSIFWSPLKWIWFGKTNDKDVSNKNNSKPNK